MKDSLLNLLVFLLVFIGSAVFFLGTYGLSMILVPGGRGLVFASPYAAALMPALLCALMVALYRSFHRPGVFAVTWVLLAAGFFLTLTLPVPVIQQMPSVRASDDTPVVPGRFFPLEDGSLLLSTGNSAVVVPQDGTPMQVAPLAQYDSLNGRIVLSTGEAKAIGSSGPERLYYQYTPELASLQTDLLAIYQILRDSWTQNPLLFWFQAWAITWIFLGLYLAFSLKTWPLVHMVLMLVLVRLALVFLVYAFWALPLVVDQWVNGPTAAGLKAWCPVVLVDVAAATLFFMTWLSKPHRRRALS